MYIHKILAVIARKFEKVKSSQMLIFNFSELNLPQQIFSQLFAELTLAKFGRKYSFSTKKHAQTVIIPNLQPQCNNIAL
jgi:hypothetical protein